LKNKKTEEANPHQDTAYIDTMVEMPLPIFYCSFTSLILSNTYCLESKNQRKMGSLQKLADPVNQTRAGTNIHKRENFL
jgi:hypothetical protein